jgi:hypothetical protein
MLFLVLGLNKFSQKINLPSDVIVVHVGEDPASAGLRVCRPPQTVRLPCGTAFNDWKSRGGFGQVCFCVVFFDTDTPQLSDPAVSFSSAVVSGVPFCGASPVSSRYSFSANGNAVGNASFWTLDGSCDCNYCYIVEDFDWTNTLPPCFTQSASGFNVSSLIFDTAPNSAGLLILSTAVSQNLTSGPIVLFKSQLSFWLRTELLSSDGVSLRLVQGSTSLTVPQSALSSCPYNSASASAWTGSTLCVVTVDLCAVPGFQNSTAVNLQFAFSSQQTRRVLPEVTTAPAPPLRGFWIDTIKSCGSLLSACPSR